MARGFLSGVLWGGVVGVGVSGVASVLAPAANGPQVAALAPDVAQAPEQVGTASSGETASTPDSTVVTGAAAPQVSAPEPDTAVTLDPETLTSPAQAQVPAPSALPTPDEDTDAVDVAASTEPAVIPTPQALAPMAPDAPDDAQIDTAPAEAPVVAEVPAEQPAEDVTAETDAPQTDQVDETAQAAVAEEDPAAPVDQAQAEEIAEAAEDTETETAALVPEVQLQPVTPPARVTETPTEEAEAEPEAQEDAPATNNLIAGTTRPRIGTQVGTLTDRDTGVTIRRPSSATLGEVDSADAPETQTAAAAPATADARPISRFSAAFTPDGDKPLMAIVLIDDGSSPVTGSAGIAALRGFPYPLSFAVDTTLEDAVQRMGLYRKEGFEVMAMVDLPAGAQPEDAETALGVVLPQMDQVVGILEGPDGGLQPSRAVADQVTSILLQTGHGLLAQDKGLNTMPKLARKEGVPADPIFRDFDSKGQTAAVIRRFLDQAAFKAGQEGAVVMLGRMRPDTVSALLLWGLQDRAGKVSLSPISAVLLRDQ